MNAVTINMNTTTDSKELARIERRFIDADIKAAYWAGVSGEKANAIWEAAYNEAIDRRAEYLAAKEQANS
jgi:hypothetical protein